MRKFTLLKLARVLVSLLVLAVFLAAYSSLCTQAGIAAKAEYLPAFLRSVAVFAAGSLLAFGLLTAGTLLFGRFYCSFCCPLGALQDIASRLGKIVSFGRFRYRLRPDRWKLRYTVLILLLALAAGSWLIPLGYLEPYTLFGRNMAGPGQALFTEINNFLYNRFDLSIPLEERPAFPLSQILIAGGVMTLILLAAAWRGRPFCNLFCPTGALLGILSRSPRFRLQIDPNKCVKCGKCAKVCKAGCIDVAKQTLQTERCVLCMNCGSVCRFNAIRFSPRPEAEKTAAPANRGRREFLALAGISGLLAFLGGRLVQRVDLHGRRSPVMPPGAGSHERLTAKCTGCGLCIANCTGKVLTPAFLEYGLGGMGQPHLVFHNGMCEFNCHKCTQLCPTGALKPMTLKEKQLCRIGQVQFYRDRCVVVTEETSCGACAEHCPTGALQMIPYKDGLTVPSVIADLCIGCGGCQYICPVVRRDSGKAVMVSGVELQGKADSPEHVLGKAEKKQEEPEDFPF